MLAAAFLLIPAFGLPGTLRFAGCANLLLALAAFLLSRTPPSAPAIEPVPPPAIDARDSERGLLQLLLLTALGCALLAPSAMAQAPLPPLDAPNGKIARFQSKPAGTQETTKFWFGPYAVPPGHDMNRVDIDLPLQDGYIELPPDPPAG